MATFVGVPMYTLLSHKYKFIRGCVEKVHANVSKEMDLKCKKELQSWINYTKFNDGNGDTTKYNILYVNVLNGLGNKLRAIAAAYNFFTWLCKTKLNSSDWKMIIVWKLDEHCMAAHDDLFTLESLCQGNPNISFTNDISNLSLAPSLKFYGHSSSTPIFEPNRESINKLILYVKERSHATIYMESANVIDFPAHDWESDCKYLRSLVVVRPIQDIIDRLTAEISSAGFKLSSMIGVHIRCGQDGTAFDNIDKWPEDKKLQWNKWRGQSQYAKYISSINKNDSNAAVYIASDSKEVYTNAKIDLSGRIFMYDREAYDRSRDQVITGLVDAIMLSKTSILYGSNWSSFTELVIRLGVPKNMLAGVHF